MLQKFKNAKGFTLLEVLISVGILAILTPMVMYLMIVVYQSLASTSEYDDQTNDFRIFSNNFANELLFADNIRVEKTDEYEILYYRNNNGNNKAIIFDNDEGLIEWNVNTNEKTFITLIKRYDADKDFIEVFDNDKIRFNVFASDINALILFSVDSRKNGVYK